MTALHMAVDTEESDMIEYLLSVKTIDLGLKDSDGNTASDCASSEVKKIIPKH